MKRKGLLLILILFLAEALSPAVLISASWAIEKVAIGTPSKGIPTYDLMIFAEEEKRLAEKEGLEFSWFTFRGGADMFRAMAAGAVEMGLADAASAVQAIARKLPILIVADLQDSQDFYIWVRQASPIRHSGELKGTKIGVSRFGGAAHAYGQVIIKGLGLEKNVKFVAAGGQTERLAALKSGAIDGFVQTVEPMANLVAMQEVRQVASSREFLPKRWVAHVVTTHSDFVKARPLSAKKGVAIILQLAKFQTENPGWVAEILKSKSGYREAAAMLVAATVKYGYGKIDKEGLANVLNFLADYGIVPKKDLPAVDKIVNEEMLP